MLNKANSEHPKTEIERAVLRRLMREQIEKRGVAFTSHLARWQIVPVHSRIDPELVKGMGKTK